jgi:lipid A ethanolaminephosphotransferase
MSRRLPLLSPRPHGPQLSAPKLNLLVSLGLLVFYNGAFWTAVLERRSPGSLGDGLFLAGLVLLLLATLNLFLSAIAVKHLQKPLTVALLTSAALAAFFMDSYGVLIDYTMFQNAVETDSFEVAGFLGWRLLLYVSLLAVLPSIFVLRTRVVYRPWIGEIKRQATIALLSAAAIGLVAVPFYRDYLSLFDHAHGLRHRLSPVNYLYGGAKYLRQSLQRSTGIVRPLGEDARLGPAAARRRPSLIVLVVGETARAREFSLNGYRRETNPQLSREAVLSFGNVTACGTSTAVSVPCIFSSRGHDSFDCGTARNEEGLLDVLAHAGIRVLWRDNNSGCKGVCDRIDSQDVSKSRNPEHCNSRECFDEVLLDDLNGYLESADGDVFVVLHQKGSHGPDYYLRYPKRFERFTPVCASNDLQHCTVQEVVNAYDNTILYTDYFLARVIRFLKERSRDYDTAMLYISDHGESLGEGHLYLHGLPRFLAPEAQTHVPFVAWLSEEIERTRALDPKCLDDHLDMPLSHDNLFHSVLGLMDVETRVYDSSLDVFAGSCRRSMVTAQRRVPGAAPIQPERAAQVGLGDPDTG